MRGTGATASDAHVCTTACRAENLQGDMEEASAIINARRCVPQLPAATTVPASCMCGMLAGAVGALCR